MIFTKLRPGRALAAFILALTLLLVLLPTASPLAQGDSWAGAFQPFNSLERPAPQSAGVDPPRGPPGSRISISGYWFRDFSTVESITMGGINILGNRTVTTDIDGFFQVDGLIVPGLDPGIVGIVVRVGTGNLETTSVGTFEVTAPTTSSSIAVPVEEAFGPLGDALDRVFHFDNATKYWSFYDTRPGFYDGDLIQEVVEGQVYWVRVKYSTTAVLNTRERQLTCANEGTLQQDCWNVVVW